MSRELLTSHMGGPFAFNKHFKETYVVSSDQLAEEHHKLNEDTDERLTACMLIKKQQPK